MQIHYTSGPEILSDVSFETTSQIEKMFKQGMSVCDIANALDVNEKIVQEVYSIYRAGLKRCCFCGELFDAKGHSRRITCYKEKHYLPCIDCGSLVEIKESYANYMKAGGRRCSACRAKQIGATRRGKSVEEKQAIVDKQQATMVERYGAATALQVPEMKAKIQATIKERYGVDNLSQSAEIQDRIRKNSQEKYGVDHYSNAPEIRKHMEDGMIAKYGVKHAQQNAEIQEKTKKTNMEKYGVENVLQSKEIQATFVKNHRAKYGVDWPGQRPELKERAVRTNIEKYGAPMYPVSDEYMRNFISDPSRFELYKEFMDDPESYILSHYVDKPSVKQLSRDLGVTDSPIYDKLIAIGRRDLATEYAYTMETELIEFIHTLDSNIVTDKHNRVILKGREIDLYLPDFNIGFECNPTYTHNSSFCDPWGAPPKHYKYHADKSKDAHDQGVFIYHIFGYEWTHRRSLIESQIRNLLSLNDRKLYARNTYVSNIDYAECCAFLDANHRQGSAQAKIRLGLRLKDSDELVSVMTFGKMRPGIGKKDNQSDNEWELVRFCNLQNTSVTGAASKLFKYFMNEYQPDKVVSFSDLAHTRGTLYEKLGFESVSISDPGYVWVNLETDDFYSRVSCQKSNLPNLFEDITAETIQNHTESEIMMDHNYARVFDSGVIRWEYTPS